MVFIWNFTRFVLVPRMDCHTPLVQGQNDMTKVGAGGRQQPAPGGGFVISTNLTPANEHGIAHWTDQQIKTAITQGVRPDRPLVRLMAFDWYKHSSSADWMRWWRTCGR